MASTEFASFEDFDFSQGKDTGRANTIREEMERIKKEREDVEKRIREIDDTIRRSRTLTTKHSQIEEFPDPTDIYKSNSLKVTKTEKTDTMNTPPQNTPNNPFFSGGSLSSNPFDPPPHQPRPSPNQNYQQYSQFQQRPQSQDPHFQQLQQFHQQNFNPMMPQPQQAQPQQHRRPQQRYQQPLQEKPQNTQQYQWSQQTNLQDPLQQNSSPQLASFPSITESVLTSVGGTEYLKALEEKLADFSWSDSDEESYESSEDSDSDDSSIEDERERMANENVLMGGSENPDTTMRMERELAAVRLKASQNATNSAFVPTALNGNLDLSSNKSANPFDDGTEFRSLRDKELAARISNLTDTPFVPKEESASKLNDFKPELPSKGKNLNKPPLPAKKKSLKKPQLPPKKKEQSQSQPQGHTNALLMASPPMLSNLNPNQMMVTNGQLMAHPPVQDTNALLMASSPMLSNLNSDQQMLGKVPEMSDSSSYTESSLSDTSDTESDSEDSDGAYNFGQSQPYSQPTNGSTPLSYNQERDLKGFISKKGQKKLDRKKIQKAKKERKEQEKADKKIEKDEKEEFKSNKGNFVGAPNNTLSYGTGNDEENGNYVIIPPARSSIRERQDYKDSAQMFLSMASAPPATLRGSIIEDATPFYSDTFYDVSDTLDLEPEILGIDAGTKLVFGKRDKTKYPKLQLPKSPLRTKYDYSQIKRNKTFSYDSILPNSTEAEVPEEIIIDDAYLDTLMDEPNEGMLPYNFNKQVYDDFRLTKITYIEYSPFSFSRKNNSLPYLKPLHEYEEYESILDISQVAKCDHPADIKMINLSNTNTPSSSPLTSSKMSLKRKNMKKLARDLSIFSNTQVLILQGLGLRSIAGFVFRSVQYVDFSNNKIVSFKSLWGFLKNCASVIEVLNLQRNPVFQKSKLKIIAICPRLRILNGEKISIETYLGAIAAHGSKHQKRNFELLRWDKYFTNLRIVRRMNSWQPEKITKLILTKCNLVQFHVGTLFSLEYLDLSDNNIVDTQGGGLERLNHLTTICLNRNRITKRMSLDAFQFVPSLKSVELVDNKLGNKTFTGYRLYTIFVTRNLKGTNRALGLQEIDRKPITIKERILAYEQYHKLLKKTKRISPADYRWGTLMIDSFGHKQMLTPNFIPLHCRHFLLAQRNLCSVDVSTFVGLEVLDLSANILVEVKGLENLKNLKLLNLSGNVKLNLKSVLRQLINKTMLEQVSLCVMRETHKRNPLNLKYRLAVLYILLQNNRPLQFLDNIFINPLERIEIFKKIQSRIHKAPKKTVTALAEEYRFKLGVVLSTTEYGPDRKLHHDDLLTNGAMEYDPDQVISLLRMNHLQLTSKFSNFAPFSCVEEINLSHNALTDLSIMGLESLSNSLRVLDVSYNLIKNPISYLARLLDSLTALECVALHDNPCFKSPKARTSLIGAMSATKEVECQLQVIDTELTIDERIDAWKKVGGSEEECEDLRYKAVMWQRAPRDIPACEVTALGLNAAGFKSFEINQFVSLKYLLLRGNYLTTVQGTGIETLSQLIVLDLRDNLLKESAEVAYIVHQCKQLTSLGIEGNKFSNWRPRKTSKVTKEMLKKKTKYRIRFLQQIPELHSEYCALRMLDEKEITADEIVVAWSLSMRSSKETSLSPDKMKFQVMLLRTLPPSGETSDITELDISSCKLSSIDLSPFCNVEKLSMSFNIFKDLKTSNIQELSKLYALDIRNNQFKSFDLLCQEICKLPLEILYVAGNPCYPRDTPELRRKLIAQFLHYHEPTNLKLYLLNGVEITPMEICQALPYIKAGKFSKDAIERIRLDLSFQHLQVEKTQTELNLSGYGFSKIDGVQQLQNLTHLILRNNLIKKMEAEVYNNLPNLYLLDLRNNEISSLKEIIGCLQKGRNFTLQLLYIQNATKKDTATPRKYVKKVCAGLRWLESVDDLRNPYGTHNVARRTQTVQKRKMMDVQTVGHRHTRKQAQHGSEITPAILGDSSEDANFANDEKTKEYGDGFYHGYDLASVTTPTKFSDRHDLADSSSDESSSDESSFSLGSTSSGVAPNWQKMMTRNSGSLIVLPEDRRNLLKEIADSSKYNNTQTKSPESTGERRSTANPFLEISGSSSSISSDSDSDSDSFFESDSSF